MGKINLYLAAVLLTGVGVVQSTAMPYLSLAGVKPDLMLLVVISWSLIRGAGEGIVWGFVGGMILDLLSGAPFGVFTLALTTISFLSGIGEINIFRSNIFLPLMVIGLATIAYSFISLLLLQTLGWPVNWSDSLIRIVLPTAFLNTILAPLIYQPLRWLHSFTV
ncbi:MAG: rod shape-determining protein MreD [Anaerolineae bacterium]